MAAIITDQLRILNCENFVAGVASTSNSYYSWLGLPNPADFQSDWDSNPPSPKDAFSEERDYWDTMIALKKINAADIARVVRKITWSSGTTYEMYRDDYSRTNISPQTSATNLYDANYYVMNQDYRVYICLQNGTDPENTEGRPSLDEPLFTDLEPRSAGASGDQYIWKYLFTINPNDLIKFDSTSFIPLPQEWSTNNDVASVRNNAATSGQLKVVTITSRGVGYGTAATYNNVPILGDGSGGKCSVVINAAGKIDSVEVTNGGSGYTFGNVGIANVGLNNPEGSTDASFNVIIPPQNGHGADIYNELGGNRALIYSRIENDTTNPDFITGNQFARIGVVANPYAYGSTNLLALSKASGLYALKIAGAGATTTTFTYDSEIRQEIGIGSTAVGRVINWDSTTGVLKYWQDRRLAISTDGTAPTYGYELFRFTADPTTGAGTTIFGGSSNLNIDTNFGTALAPGLSTSINNKTYNLGMSFVKGVANPEVEKYSGQIIYVDNRASITRSSQQKEDIKIVLEF
jgi:hypothetical protein